MSEGAAAASASDGQKDSVQSQLAQLVPTYDPGIDSVETWSQKIQLLLLAWPESKLKELATRIVLNTKGSAFQKLQLHQSEIFTGDVKGIEKIVSLVGGSFGQVELEKRFEIAEKAIYRCVQKQDETADSFLARADVAWTELLAKKMSLSELQAYITLRGSRLAGEDKKRVLVESGAEGSGALEMSNVAAAVRMLGSSFFQEYAYGRKDKSLKTYDHTAFVTEDWDESHDDSRFCDDWHDDDFEYLAHEDDDAALVVQFESAIVDTLQDDKELSAFFANYQEARRRLVEKTKSRGFWGPPKGKGFGKKGGKGKQKGFRSKTLSQRIAETACRRCGRIGHWRAECPLNQGSSDSKTEVPTSVAITHEAAATVISEPNNNDDDSFAFLEQFDESSSDTQLEEFACLVALHGKSLNPKRFCEALKKRLNHVAPRLLRNPKMPQVSHEVKVPSNDPNVPREIDGHCLFCSTGTIGVVDLGASQSVIGSDQLKELLEQLPPHIHRQVKRQPVDLTFRFGNHQTLQSKVAVHFPLQQQWFRVAVVPGKTPFLLSSNFLQGLKAVIDTHECTLWSKVLQRYIPVQQNAKNLMLMDINNLWDTAAEGTVLSTHAIDGADKRPSVGSVESWNAPVDTTVDRGNDVAASESQTSANMSHVQSYRGKTQSEDVEKMTLAQLAETKIDFGKSKYGLTYQEAFMDLEWTQFIVSRYEGSDKVEHRRYLQYVKMRLEEADQGQEPIRPKTNVKTVNKKSPGPSTMAKPVETEEESDWEQMSLHTQNQSEMESRMNRMEEALAQVINHIQNVSRQDLMIQPKAEP
eukprot:s532_g19.t1